MFTPQDFSGLASFAAFIVSLYDRVLTQGRINNTNTKGIPDIRSSQGAVSTVVTLTTNNPETPTPNANAACRIQSRQVAYTTATRSNSVDPALSSWVACNWIAPSHKTENNLRENGTICRTRNNRNITLIGNPFHTDRDMVEILANSFKDQKEHKTNFKKYPWVFYPSIQTSRP